MFPELSEAIQRSKNRALDRNFRNPGLSEVSPGFYGVMKAAADNNSIARPEYVADCLKLVADKTAGKINLDDFTQSVSLLETVSEKKANQ